MIQLALLLFGADFVRRRATALGVIGLLWAVMGLVVFIDGLDGVRYFPITLFGLFLLAESLVTLVVASTGQGAQKTLLAFKGGIFLLVALLLLLGGTLSNLLLAIVLGLSYFLTGVFQIASAWIVRFPRWRQSLAMGVVLILFAIFLLNPYPTFYAATLSLFIGFMMMSGGLTTLHAALRARRLRDGGSVAQLLAPPELLEATPTPDALPATPSLGTAIKQARLPLPAPSPITPATDATGQPVPLIVHVWTPEGCAEHETVPRPVFNRYIAAVDRSGVISTGHASLELPPGTYISLYPALDIDRSPSEFFNVLKAVKENDVPGRFLPDYATEAGDWCDSTSQVRFAHYNATSLLAFWDAYRQREIYNLTRHNCSSSVAYALEAALDGVLRERGEHPAQVLRTLLMPELWIAAQMRHRAQTMAWTPGLALDYARALHAIVHPVPASWLQRLGRVLRQKRRQEEAPPA